MHASTHTHILVKENVYFSSLCSSHKGHGYPLLTTKPTEGQTAALINLSAMPLLRRYIFLAHSEFPPNKSLFCSISLGLWKLQNSKTLEHKRVKHRKGNIVQNKFIFRQRRNYLSMSEQVLHCIH